MNKHEFCLTVIQEMIRAGSGPVEEAAARAVEAYSIVDHFSDDPQPKGSGDKGQEARRLS